MTWDRGWRQRENGVKDKRAARAEREADPAWQAIQAERKAHLLAQEEAARLQVERERAERDAPVREVVEMLRERFGSDLPDFAAAVKRVGGLTKVADYLNRTLSNHEKAVSEASLAELTEAQSTRARVARAKSTEERRARQEAVIAERLAIRAAQTSQDTAQIA